MYFFNSNAQVEVTREIERDAEVLTQRMRTRTLFQLSTIRRKFGKPALFQWENPAEVEVCLRRSFAFVSSLRRKSCETLSKKKPRCLLHHTLPNLSLPAGSSKRGCLLLLPFVCALGAPQVPALVLDQQAFLAN